MTPDDYICKAIRAIETDQPNLAMLYMRRGIIEMKRLNPNPLQDVIDGMIAFATALNHLAETFVTAVATAFEPFARAINQADFALVSE